MSNTRHESAETKAIEDSLQRKVQSHDPIVSDEARVVLETVFFAALNGSFSLLGLVVNIINIIVFFKQGFSDSVNISLFSLAVSDLCTLVFTLWISICSNRLFQYSNIGFDSIEVHYLTGGMPHSCLVRTTSFITAFIAFERCVCIALPLKVRDILTPKRTLISIVAMSIIIIFTTAMPVYLSTYLGPSFYAKRNISLVGLIFTSNAKYFENISLSFTVSVQLSSFIVIIICTVILVLKLVSKSQWRQQSISVSDVPDSLTIRDKRVMKMVTLISIIFIICYLPNTFDLILMVHLSPEYSTSGKYNNCYIVSWAIVNTIDGINSSVTILVYYNMSSKFRSTFNELFCAVKEISVKVKTPLKKQSTFCDK